MIYKGYCCEVFSAFVFFFFKVLGSYTPPTVLFYVNSYFLLKMYSCEVLLKTMLGFDTSSKYVIM